MSSLWTPGGEVPIDRNRGDQPADPAPTPPPADDDQLSADDEAIRAQIEAMQAQMLQMPAADVIAEHASAMYQLAVLHLSQEQPKLADARLAIDALDALVTGLGSRLGRVEEPLRDAVGQLKMAFVQVQNAVEGESAD